MLVEKKTLSIEEIEAQTALELPDRELMALVNVTIFDVASHNNVLVQLPIGVAANVCGVQANVLAQQVNQTGTASCTAQPGQTLQALPPGLV